MCVCPAVKNVRGEYYLNGHWTIDFSRALRVASTVLHYDRASEGDLAPELLHARGPTTEPLIIEVRGSAFPCWHSALALHGGSVLGKTGDLMEPLGISKGCGPSS